MLGSNVSEEAIHPLPPNTELEPRSVLKRLAPAHRYLAELKGMAATIPNEHILINTLALQEAKDSSEIENIITTHDDLYKADLFSDYIKNPAAKEVSRYATALKTAFEQVRQDQLITVNRIIEIHRVLEQNNAGIRKLPGTALKNDRTGEIVYTPPQDHDEIVRLMDNLERFINDDAFCDADPLVKMAVIHHQFESIHPFYDGNGRTGRIINILYLVAKGLLDIPVLYLSRYIIRTKPEYYRLLQQTRETGDRKPWILYMLEGVECTSRQTIWIIQQIKEIMMAYKHRIRTELPKIYSQDLLNNLFRHPYTKIESVQHDLGVSRLTAAKYLELLTEKGFIEKHKIGRYNYYVNRPLMNIFMDIPEMPENI
ncbi:MAG TPA: Fic family protein [Sedimenticola sp.]|nr:Fic family protein [Sedimenticola sp.]